MPRKYDKTPLKQKLFLLKNAGLKNNEKKSNNDFAKIDELNARIKKILDLSETLKTDKTKMLFFVMYDIQDNKVRREIAKYLQSKGCVRIQKSIFFASAERKIFSKIHKDIKDVQSFYENNDSIIIVPVSTDEIRSMKIIGQNIDFDIVMNNKNTLFF